MAHDVSYRNSDQKGRGDSLQHDKARASESVVEADETEQEAGQQAVDAVGFQIVETGSDDFRIGGESAAENVSVKESQPKHSDSESGRQTDRGLKAFYSTLRLPGAVVLRHEGAHGLHEGERNEHDKSTDLLGNSYARRGDEAQRIDDGEHYEKREPDQQILQRDRCSEAHDPGQDGRLNPDILAGERKGKSPAAQYEKRNEDAERLGGDCRKRSSCSTHMKTRDQKKITRNVADTCDCNGDQRRVGIAKALESPSPRMMLPRTL